MSEFTREQFRTRHGIAFRYAIPNASGDAQPVTVEASAAGVSLDRRWPIFSTREQINGLISAIEQAWSDHLTMRGAQGTNLAPVTEGKIP